MRAPLFAALLACAPASASAAEPLVYPAWMQGCWQWVNADPGSVEQWTAPAGGLMLGMSKTIKSGKLSAFRVHAHQRSGTGQAGLDGPALGRRADHLPAAAQPREGSHLREPGPRFPATGHVSGARATSSCMHA
ncbi:DUF6265 family protein [Massilia sp. H-1]|nr:DUF6265 family protein [Massilia sp. H-1]